MAARLYSDHSKTIVRKLLSGVYNIKREAIYYEMLLSQNSQFLCVILSIISWAMFKSLAFGDFVIIVHLIEYILAVHTGKNLRRECYKTKCLTL